MKDNEFIELLNLYLDHEISDADAARLEAEVQRTPARYRVYREYCQMQKACALLSPSAASAAPAAATFETHSRKWTTSVAFGGLMAAAACAAFVFLNRAQTSAPLQSERAMAATPMQAAAAVPDGAVTPVAPQAARSIGPTITVVNSPVRSERPTGLETQTLRWNTGDFTVAPAAADARFRWIETLQLTSVPQVPADDLRFETKSTPKDGPRGFSQGQFEGPAAYNALLFTR